MFSTRIPAGFSPNRLTEALRRHRAAGRPLIDLTESNPTRAGLDYPDDLLRPLADTRGLVYTPQPLGLVEARCAVARDYARRGAAVDPGRIALTASTSEAYSLLFKLLASPGDEILVPRPSYPLFEHLTAFEGLTPRGYDLEYHGSWSIEMGSVERAVGPRARAILIVSPNNPTGSFVSADELDRLTGICAERGMALIADEVFADYSFGSAEASRYNPDECRPGPFGPGNALVFALGGLSKSVGLPQLKLGWMAVGGPDRIVSEAMQRLELICDTYLSVSTPVQLAAAELLERGAAIREQIRARVSGNYGRLNELVAEVPSCRVLLASGGWYGVVQVPAVRSEEDLVVDVLNQDGVLVHPGYFFDFPRESFLILSLLPPEEVFVEGVRRLLSRCGTLIAPGSAIRHE